MDTQLAITTLQDLLTIKQGELTDAQAKIDALTIAISQLQGTLQTQATELEKKYQSTIDDLTAQNTDLQAQVTELSTTVTTPPVIETPPIQ
jgi:polyhydroxyalkanoate synthesis regulator phasin